MEPSKKSRIPSFGSSNQVMPFLSMRSLNKERGAIGEDEKPGFYFSHVILEIPLGYVKQAIGFVDFRGKNGQEPYD